MRFKSFRLQFSLRSLLVFITLFMLWGGYHTNRCWKERAAEEVLRRHQASFIHGPKKSGAGFLSSLRFAYQKLVQLVWRERFITHVTMDAPLEPEAVDALCNLPHVLSMHLGPYSTFDERIYHRPEPTSPFRPDVKTPPGAFERILAHSQLQIFHCHAWILSDEDCQAIGRHPNLQEVWISTSYCSEEGFVELVKAPRLSQLMFSCCDITGAKLASQPGSPSLKFIKCDHAPVGPDFAAYVARCPNLTRLEARGPTIDDNFIKQFASHPRLAELGLPINNATDECVLALVQMPSLQSVSLPRKKVSQQAIDRLQKANPLVKVYRY